MRSVAFAAFFLSGASSLIFQSIWSRMLAHVFGASSVAISTTVSVFMAGLGLGAFLAGRYADRIKHPVITYAVVEGLVGVWALLVPLLVSPEGWLSDVNGWLRAELGAESMGFMIARFLCVVPILLIPTTLMGSSLPLLSRHFVQRSQKSGDIGSWVGALYAVNTFGAVAGVNLGAFVLMPNVGVTATNIIAACMNFALCGGIFLMRRRLLGDTWKPGEKLQWLPRADDDAQPAEGSEAAAPDTEDGAGEDTREPESRAADAPTAPSKPSVAWIAGGVVAIAFGGGLFFAVDGSLAIAVAIPFLLGGFVALGHYLTARGRAGGSAAEPPPGEPEGDAPTDELLDASLQDDPDAPALPIPPIARKAAFFAFALSGLAALCYEVVWTRALAMTIGSSFWGFALILQTFLIGIALGSAIASGAIKAKRLLPTSALASLLLIALANALWGIHHPRDNPEGGLVMWLTLFAVFAVPVVAIWAAVRHRRQVTGDRSAPVAPALLMLLVPAVASLFNVLLFDQGRFEGAAVIIAAVTCTLALFLALVVGLRRYPVLQLAMMPLFIALAAFVNYIFQDDVPCAFAQMVSTIDRLYEHIGLVQFFMFLTVVLCTLPATVGMGAMFPMTLRVWTSGGESVGRDVGNVYAANTLGSILGAWLPGFVLMQSLGMERTIITGMFVYLGIALVMLLAASADRGESAALEQGDAEGAERKAPPPWYAVAIYVIAPCIPPLVVFLALLGWKPSFWDELDDMRWNLSRMTLGVFRVSLAEDACSDQWGEPDLVYYHDGLSTTVSVERWGRHYALKNNGKVDASNGDDMPTQIMVAAYPLLMHPKGPEGLDVAVVGFGSGVSVGTALKFPVRSVDVMELERAIPEASKFFEDVNDLDYVLTDFPYVQMDRLTVINDDGRNYLTATDKQYDVIVSEPSNPWITGVSDLFTTDHFRITKKRLREGGIYCQWVQLYELSPENIKVIYRTFASQFEHVVVFAAEDLSSDTVLLGSDSPLPLDLERVSAAYSLPGIREELERAYIHSPFDVFARTLLASRDEVMQFTQIEYRLRGGEWVAYPDSSNPPDRGCPPESCRREPVVLNTDDNAHIEFQAPRDLIGFQRFEGYLANIYSPEWPYGRLMEHITGFGEGEEGARNYAEMAMSLIAHGRKPEAAAFITRAQEMGGGRETLIAAEVLTRLMSGAGEPTITISPPVPGPQLAAREARELTEGFARVRQAVDIGSYGTALAAMEEIPAPLRLHSGPGMRLLYAYLLYKTAPTYQSRYREAIDQLEELIRSEEEYVLRHPEVFYFLARCHDAELNFDKAVRNMRVYVEGRLRALEEAQQGSGDDPAPTTDAPDEATDDGEPKAERDEDAG